MILCVSERALKDCSGDLLEALPYREEGGFVRYEAILALPRALEVATLAEYVLTGGESTTALARCCIAPRQYSGVLTSMSAPV